MEKEFFFMNHLANFNNSSVEISFVPRFGDVVSFHIFVIRKCRYCIQTAFAHPEKVFLYLNYKRISRRRSKKPIIYLKYNDVYYKHCSQPTRTIKAGSDNVLYSLFLLFYGQTQRVIFVL